MEAHSGNFRAFKANRKERMRGFEMEDRRWGIRAGSQHISERRVERNRIADAEKLNSTGSKRFGITRYQLPMMFFTAKAKDSHAWPTIRITLCM
jgi:hypothetical protein